MEKTKYMVIRTGDKKEEEINGSVEMGQIYIYIYYILYIYIYYILYIFSAKNTPV